MLRTALAAALVACLLGGLARAEETLLEVEVAKDLAYVAGEKVPDRQKLDLYVPKGKGPWPVLLWIHGGAWAVGHRHDEEKLARRFAERGIAVAATDHRMSKALWMKRGLDKGVEHPVHVEDCAAAFAWLVEHAKERKLDPERMYVGGFSSGAHLAALLATDPKYLKKHEIESSRIRAAIPVSGAYDIPAYYKVHLEHNGKAMANSHVLDVFGHEKGDLEDASPSTHLAKTKVPMLVVSEIHTHDYTKHFAEIVKKAGIERIRFRHFPDRTHASIGRKMAEKHDEVRDLLIAFLRDPSATLPDTPKPADESESKERDASKTR